MAFRRNDDEQRFEEGIPSGRTEETGQDRLRGEQPLRVVGTPGQQTDRSGERMGTAESPASGRRGELPEFIVPPEEADALRSRWSTIQTRFVDEPRGAVKEADMLVAEVIRRVTDRFADERSGLERQWSRGENVSTEELRLAMQRYRSFFDRLLSR